jgi:hypothetical protein
VFWVVSGYAGGGGDRSGAALLFLAWLAEELGWATSSVSSHGGGRFTLRAEEGRAVAVYLHAVDYPTVEPGWLVSIKIACQSETARALLSISRTGDPHHLVVRTEHKDNNVEDHLRMERGSVSEMLMRELDDALHNPEFGRVLRNAVPLMSSSRIQRAK